MSDPELRYEAIAEAFAGAPGVTDGSQDPGRGNRFGSNGLKVDGRIFAMLARGTLVVKLPRARVDELVEGGHGERFDPRRNGRVMREWLSVDPAAELDWPALAREAYEFVRRGR